MKFFAAEIHDPSTGTIWVWGGEAETLELALAWFTKQASAHQGLFGPYQVRRIWVANAKVLGFKRHRRPELIRELGELVYTA